ncbi:MAG: hypothetical protein U1B78_04930 [Dehalococcoidia bacterium]|nr:hypothetical protein [Dehalococcoidia bacterium]
MPDDKIQREIEDILSRLEDFVPEESATSRMRRRSSDAAGAFGRGMFAPLTRISLRHVMLTALALVVIGFLARGVQFGQWMLIAGVILLLTSFALSFVSRGGGNQIEKRWRGQPMELNGPSLGERLRAWFQSRRRPRY